MKLLKNLLKYDSRHLHNRFMNIKNNTKEKKNSTKR